MKTPKILFICKKRKSSGTDCHYTKTISSGLLNSATFVNQMLINNKIDSNIVEVVDNNEIDKQIKKYKPNIVIIEALWVVPEKFEILHKIYPNINWIIRLHSEIPFISNEGIAIDWIKKYSKYDYVDIAVNSKRIQKELKVFIKRKIFYLPNYYFISKKIFPKVYYDSNIINISCFGAIRPLKNHLLQAICAIEFANQKNKTLRFHINNTRTENKGEPVLKNLQNLFKNSKHQLIEHKWLEHKHFLELISRMDLNLQVSFSETFNIITADAVSQNVPVITSSEIKWIPKIFYAKTTNFKSILKKIKFIWIIKKIKIHYINRLFLKYFNYKSEQVWLKFLKFNFWK